MEWINFYFYLLSSPEAVRDLTSLPFKFILRCQLIRTRLESTFSTFSHEILIYKIFRVCYAPKFWIYLYALNLFSSQFFCLLFLLDELSSANIIWIRGKLCHCMLCVLQLLNLDSPTSFLENLSGFVFSEPSTGNYQRAFLLITFKKKDSPKFVSNNRWCCTRHCTECCIDVSLFSPKNACWCADSQRSKPSSLNLESTHSLGSLSFVDW